MIIHTLTTLEATGLKLFKLEGNKWVRLENFSLPARCLVLYDDDFKPMGLGVY